MNFVTEHEKRSVLEQFGKCFNGFKSCYPQKTKTAVNTKDSLWNGGFTAVFCPPNQVLFCAKGYLSCNCLEIHTLADSVCNE